MLFVVATFVHTCMCTLETDNFGHKFSTIALSFTNGIRRRYYVLVCMGAKDLLHSHIKENLFLFRMSKMKLLINVKYVIRSLNNIKKHAYICTSVEKDVFETPFLISKKIKILENFVYECVNNLYQTYNVKLNT